VAYPAKSPSSHFYKTRVLRSSKKYFEDEKEKKNNNNQRNTALPVICFIVVLIENYFLDDLKPKEVSFQMFLAGAQYP